MRFAAVLFSLAVLATPALAGAERLPGSIEIDDGRGVITVRGRGALLGRIDRGVVTIADLTPTDQWSPRVNGIPRGRFVTVRGRDVTFYVPAGRYRVTVRGEGINVSARGTGVALLDGEPDPTGAAGTYSVDDGPTVRIPADPVRAPFGPSPSVPPPVPLRGAS